MGVSLFYCSKCAAPLKSPEEISITKTLITPTERLKKGRTIAARYQILEELGRGGMGVVYKAEDTKLKRTVALKFLPPELTHVSEVKERFMREAQAAAALDHPNICTVYEFDEAEKKTFISMAYVEGQSLKKKIESGPLELDEALRISLQIAGGLQQAHKKGVVHRDIKSANIMVTEDGQAKIMDFGLARVTGGTLVTQEGMTMGTVTYMSPEQARGEEVDHRSDIWSLGVVLYEMFSGKLPFLGDREASILYSVVHEEPKALKAIKSDIPVELQQIINRALKKKPDSRYSSIGEMLKELQQYQESLRSPEFGIFNLKSLLRRIRKPRVAMSAILILLAIVPIAVWFLKSRANIRWAREEAIPKISHLVDMEGNWNAAYFLAKKAERYIPKDLILKNLWSKFSQEVTIKSEPSGAKVFRKDYLIIDDDWEYLGQTPIESIRFPYEFSRLRFEKEGYVPLNAADVYYDISNRIFKLDEEGTIPGNMARVPGGEFSIAVYGLEHLTVKMNDYLIDKYEVTNKEFKQFIDNGGYEKGEYWRQSFEKNGRILSWEDAVSEFKDKTGRPGPATWEVGDYPEGQANYPVTGVSWYEAAAYAEFAGKSLPTIYHWEIAAGNWARSFIILLSNFDDSSPASVGSYQGLGIYGTFDMAGNVREWCWNESGNQRFILGGGWNDQPYMFNEPFAQDPFDRSSTNGFRCIKILDPDENLAELLKPIKRPFRDFLKEKPVSDEIFNIYKRMYAYDKTDLNAVIELEDDSAEDWIKQRISFDAAYGNERVIAYLFLPKISNPPYQTIVYFPGMFAVLQRSSDTDESIQIQDYDFIIKSGRAVIYPVYKGTHERDTGLRDTTQNNTNFYKEHVIYWVKDLSRSIDYLETRSDIDTGKLAYYGLSWGGKLGALLPAIEERLKLCVLNGAGFNFQRALPDVDLINYISRVKIPVLMLNGRLDHIFPYETSQIPMFQLFGTPPENKQHKVYNTGHLAPRNELIKETLDWFDRYLSSVK